MNKPRVLFLGTADFAIPSLEFLMEDSRVEVVGVITQPDRPVGRKQVLQATPVKEFLRETFPEFAETKIFQPEKLKADSTSLLNKLQPDLIITAAYGQIVPKNMLEYPLLEAWNLHGSILPLLRGAVPVHMAILQGFEETGVTLQKMAVEMDAGDILAISRREIAADETTASLMAKLATDAANLLENNINKIIGRDYELLPQNAAEATFCYQKDIAKDQAEISTEISAQVIERMVRGFYPWPVAWMTLQNGSNSGKRLKIFKTSKPIQTHKFINLNEQPNPGEIYRHDEQLYLACINNESIELQEIQLEGKERRPADEYVYLLD